MRSSKVLSIATLLFFVSIAWASAALFSDGFESYTATGVPLDKNTSGPNAAPNGSGNPWFGPAPPNSRVVGTEGSVSPHGGVNMIRGSAPSDLDQNWYNLAYRLNGGSAYTGNIVMDWWFYDPLGSGGSNFRDSAGIGFYNTAPSGTDYPGTGSLNTGVTQIQRLVLGASSATGTGYDSTKYQARVVGAVDGYSSGWFNLSLTRTVGWHEGRIVIGPALGDNTATVDFYIDDMGTPLLSHNSVSTFGFNVLEMNDSFGPTTGYFDDVTFDTIPEPGPSVLFLSGCGVFWLGRRKSQAVRK